MIMDIREVLSHLPHRYPFLLVDRVLEFEPDKRIVALKNVTINEPFFPGHFPGHPIMPGVMIIEAMAQCAAILAFKSANEPGADRVVYFLGIDNARFKSPVTPGDQLTMEIRLERLIRGIYKFSANAKVGERLAAEAIMMCTVRQA